jgi:hypothetical protein
LRKRLDVAAGFFSSINWEKKRHPSWQAARLFVTEPWGGQGFSSLASFLSTDHDEWQLGLSERQLAWLKAELANDRGTPTIIASHGPLKGTLHNYRHWINTPNAIAQPHEEIHAILRDNPQVFMWVSGHTHTPPWEDSFASAINLYDGRVTNIHNKDMNRGTIWTNSLYLYPDRVEVRTFTHADNGWVLRLDRTIIPPVR